MEINNFFTFKETGLNIEFWFYLLSLLILGLCFYNKSRFLGIRKKYFVWIAFLSQVVFILWSLGDIDFFLREGLPFFPCRIGMLAAPFLLNKKGKIKDLIIYQSIVGVVLAILAPNPYQYSFPHITNFVYYIGHFALLLGVMNLYDSQLAYLKEISVFSGVWTVVGVIVSILIPQSNYFYLNRGIMGVNLGLVGNSIVLFISTVIIICLGKIIKSFLNDYRRPKRVEAAPTWFQN